MNLPEILFDWDEENIRHLRRHRVTPAEFEEVIRNDVLDLDYETERGEPRFRSVGITNSGKVLIVVWTVRGGRIRAVTAFRASKRYLRLFLEKGKR